MNGWQWFCLIFAAVTVGWAAYAQGFEAGFRRGCEATRLWFEAEDAREEAR